MQNYRPESLELCNVGQGHQNKPMESLLRGIMREISSTLPGQALGRSWFYLLHAENSQNKQIMLKNEWNDEGDERLPDMVINPETCHKCQDHRGSTQSADIVLFQEVAG